MSDKKKTPENTQEAMEQEINFDDLEQVTGGSIKDVKYTKTTDISGDTKSKI